MVFQLSLAPDSQAIQTETKLLSDLQKNQRQPNFPNRPVQSTGQQSLSEVLSVLILGKHHPEVIGCGTSCFSMGFSQFPLCKGSNFQSTDPFYPLFSALYCPIKGSPKLTNSSIFQSSQNENVKCDAKERRRGHLIP